MADTMSEPGEAPMIQLLAELRTQIRDTGDLPAERILCTQLQVTRHMLRKALRVLRDNGEIGETKIGRRATGATPAPAVLNPQRIAQSTNPFEVMEMRMMVEPSLARLAAMRASPDEIARILEAADSTNAPSPSAADQAFHRAIAAGARNSLASELNILLHCVQTDARLRFTDRDADETTTLARVRERDAAHRAIAEAIAARDPAAAAEAMRNHLATTQMKLMGQLGLTG